MKISAIVAYSENRVIGFQNQLPWHLPADLKHFKSITMGRTILMGRKTFESIGRALPGRQNIVLTRDTSFQALDCEIAHDFSSALEKVKGEELIIIGGAKVYADLLPKISYLYLTKIHAAFQGDAFFPELPEEEWAQVSVEDCRRDEKNPYDYSFIELKRRLSY